MHAFFFFSSGQLYLSPKSPAIVMEGQSLNFTCQALGSDITPVQFSHFDENNKKTKLGLAALGRRQCVPENSTLQSMNMTFRCNFTSNTVFLTLKNPVHNQNISCEGNIPSNRSTISDNSIVFLQGISIYCVCVCVCVCVISHQKNRSFEFFH